MEKLMQPEKMPKISVGDEKQSDSKTLNSTVLDYAMDTVWAYAKTMPPEGWNEMYVQPLHPELL
jgi:hypothetical protein